jgi:hypothetical protein
MQGDGDQGLIMDNAMGLNAEMIRENILHMMCLQGYEVSRNSISIPKDANKNDLRRMNQLATDHKIAKAEPVFRKHEERLVNYIANGEEVFPEQVRPKLIYIGGGESEETLLFRYASLHWSIPVSSGYGRRLRFLVIDESNGKLIGLFGLGDPVYAIKARDKWIAWDLEIKREKLYHVLDAYVLGAVPPYSMLLGGKLVALLTLSNEVREHFNRKYANSETLIRKQRRQPWLVLITTTSALGKSSIYNRIRLNGYEFWSSVGFTQGSGEFHFSNSVYEQIKTYAELNYEPTAKDPSWGKGFRNRREVLKKCLTDIGLSTKLIYHGIQREIFVAPLASNAQQFLRGEIGQPDFFDWPANDLAKRFLERWLIPRAQRVPEYRSFRRETYRIWPAND